jgi:hypothetical protein
MAALSQVVLNEIMFDPLFSEQTDEFIEIINLSEVDSCHLTGWIIQDSDGSNTIISKGEGTVLGPGQYGVILDPDYFDRSHTYDSFIPPSALVLTVRGTTLGSRGLSNSRDETITLNDKKGNMISSHTYNTQENRSGFSEERIDPEKPDIPSNWKRSCTVHGTPGYENSIFSSSMPEKVKLSINPNPFSPDQDGIDDIAKITYSLPWNRAIVSLKIFDTLGRRIKTLQSASPSGAYHTLYWDGTTTNNTWAPVGMYIIFLEAICQEAGETIHHKKTIVLARQL